MLSTHMTEKGYIVLKDGKELILFPYTVNTLACGCKTNELGNVLRTVLFGLVEALNKETGNASNN